MAGIDAGNGKLLWRANRPGKTAVISTPIYDKGTLFVTSAYGVGCNGSRSSIRTTSLSPMKSTSTWAAPAWRTTGGAIRVGDYVYGSNSGSLPACACPTGGDVE